MKKGPPREPRERLVVYIATELKLRLQHRAVDARRSMSDLVAQAVTAYLLRK
jgi:hypothetical protein